jgi:hypothetical protein
MSRDRIAAAAAAVLVAAGIAAAFTLLGSPSHQRTLRLDHQRIIDLVMIANDVHARFDAAPEKLPPPELLPRGDGSTAARDPATGAPYAYRRTGRTSYRLCAVFAAASDPRDADGLWSHPAGRHCFELDITRDQNEPLSASQFVMLP